VKGGALSLDQMVGSGQFEIDEATLSGDNADVNLYRWLISAETAAKTKSSDDVKSHQPSFEATLIKVVTGAAPFPSPGRPLRNVVARCFLLLYTRGETKNRFDTMQTLLRSASDTKSGDAVRVACMYCIGEIMLAFGSQMMSFVTDISHAALRLIKSSSLVGSGCTASLSYY